MRTSHRPPVDARQGEPTDHIIVEAIVEDVVGRTIRPEPHKPLDAEGLGPLHELCKALLRVYRLPVPDDAYLNELIREMCDWHDVPVAETCGEVTP